MKHSEEWLRSVGHAVLTTFQDCVASNDLEVHAESLLFEEQDCPAFRLVVVVPGTTEDLGAAKASLVEGELCRRLSCALETTLAPTGESLPWLHAVIKWGQLVPDALSYTTVLF